MPAKVTKTTLAAKHGVKAKQAAAKHANDPVRYGRQELPPGIKNGIAQLREAYVGVYDQGTNQKQLDGSSAAGETYVRLVGVCLIPKTFEVDGVEVPVEGTQTSQVIPVCAKGVKYRGDSLDLEGCIAAVQNELRAIAGPDFDTSDVDKALDAIAAAQPFFKFSTSLGKATPAYPNPRTFENWLGGKGLENWSPDADSEVDDQSGGGDQPVPDEPPAFDETQGDLKALAEAADGGDADAASRLWEAVEPMGVTEEQWQSVGSYAEVLDLLNPDAAEPEPEPEPDQEPKVKDAVGYKPPVKGPGGKTTPGKKSVKCVVTAVDKKNKTVDLQNLTDKKVKYAKVAWADLEAE